MTKTANFRVLEHTLPTSYIREYPRATAENQEAELQIAIKQYVPLASARGNQQITIISAPANGFPKEIYEPLWDDLHDRLQSHGIGINGIWIADYSHQGDSGVLNEAKMGNDPSWMDHSRDMFMAINHFRDQMKRPLVGIAHSMGASALINLAIMHPRLLTTMVIIDPALVRSLKPTDFLLGKMSISRRDTWSSREAAEKGFKRSVFAQTWDPRVLDKWLQYAYRELDTSTATENTKQVTLKTSTDQEVASFLRLTFKPGNPDPVSYPDADLTTEPTTPFYRPESDIIHSLLPFLRPSALYIFGGKSYLSTPERRAEKTNSTGIGLGGSGGVAKDRVKSITFPDLDHLIPMEKVAETADACAGWLAREVTIWKEHEEAEKKEWEAVPLDRRTKLSEETKRTLKEWKPKRPRKSKSDEKPKL